MTALSDSSGNIVERYEYTVFGKATVHTDDGDDEIWMTGDDTTASASAKDNPYMFTGRRFDSETGLYYYRARYYKPEIGWFLSTDPLGYYDSMNLYTYVGNNPLNFVDPWGLCKEDKELEEELKGLIRNFRRQLRELEKQKHFWEYWDCNDYQDKIMQMNLVTEHFEIRRMLGTETFGGLGGPRRHFWHIGEKPSHVFVVVLRRGTTIPVRYLDPWMWGWPGNYSIPKNSVWEPVFGGAIDPYFDFPRPWP